MDCEYLDCTCGSGRNKTTCVEVDVTIDCTCGSGRNKTAHVEVDVTRLYMWELT